MFGSMSALGVSVTSQCDTVERSAYGFGVYMSGWPASSAPASLVGSYRASRSRLPRGAP